MEAHRSDVLVGCFRCQSSPHLGGALDSSSASRSSGRFGAGRRCMGCGVLAHGKPALDDRRPRLREPPWPFGAGPAEPLRASGAEVKNSTPLPNKEMKLTSVG